MKTLYNAGREARIEDILESLRGAVFFFNSRGEAQYINRAGRRMLDYSRKQPTFTEICGRDFHRFMDSIRCGIVPGSLKSTLREAPGNNYISVNVIPAGDGAIVTTGDSCNLSSKDYSAMCSAIFEGAADAMIILEVGTWRVIAINEKALEITGYSCSDLAGVHSEYLVVTDERESVIETLRNIAEGAVTIKRLHLRKKSGDSLAVEISGRRVSLDDNGVIVCVARDVTDRESYENEVRLRNNELSALYYISSTANSTLDISEVLNRSVRKTCDVTGMPIGCIFLLDKEKSLLIPSSCAGMDDSFLDPRETLKVDQSVEGRAIMKIAPEVVEDISSDPFMSGDFFRKAGIRSLVSVPIIYRGEVYGVMDLATRTSRRFLPEDVRLYTSIANTIGAALNNAQYVKLIASQKEQYHKLVEDLRQRNEELMLNYEIQSLLTRSIQLDDTLDSIIRNAPRLVDLNSCVIFLIDDIEKGIVSIKASPEIEKRYGKLRFQFSDLMASRDALDTLQPVVIDDACNFSRISKKVVDMLGLRAIIVLPLQARGRTLGVMWIFDTTSSRQFTGDEIARSRALSDQAAIAIDNAILFRQLTQANDRLEESYERLKSLDAMKMEMFTLISHELRTPLTTIKGYAELIRDGLLGPVTAEQRDRLERINTSVDRLAGIVSNLSDLSLLALKGYKIEQVPVSLSEIIIEVVKAVSFLASEKKIEIAVDIQPGIPMVYVDRARIQQVVLNILNNAIKYNHPGGSIHIKASERDDYVLISVSDTGIGIESKDLENIFTGFYHAGYKLSYEYKGPGLGLAISKKIVEGHGGKIWAESKPGGGSTFYFTLPKSDDEEINKAP